MPSPAPNPPDDTRSRLIEAALAAFCVEGYRASIERIAARAGVARQTLYNHFPGKEALFSAAIAQAVREVLVTLDGDGDLRETLMRFAGAYRRRVLGQEGLAIFRTLAAEAPRFPELAQQFFREGPLATRTRLAAFLSQAMAEGLLRRDDPDFAAEMFTAMLADYDRLRGLMNLEADVAADTEKTAHVLDCFLRAFASERN